MQIIRGITNLPSPARGCAVAIGNFDGVHQGHRAVLQAMNIAAKEKSCPRAVLTFYPHPRRFFQPDAPPFQIYSFKKNAQLLTAYTDYLFMLRFNAALVAMQAEDFVEQILVAQLGVRHVITGEDFRFGHSRSGDAALLKEYGTKAVFDHTPVPAFGNAEEGYLRFSSTGVRDCVASGKMFRAGTFLGAPYTIAGRVIHGEKRGRLLGFPTANIPLHPHLLMPKLGVYAATLWVDDSEKGYNAVCNIGVRPTFGHNDPLCEVHLLNEKNVDLYGKKAELELIEYIREEEQYDNPNALKRQIEIDCQIAQTMLNTHNALFA